MTRSNSKRLFCKNCDRKRNDDERFSWNGLCEDCQSQKLMESLRRQCDETSPEYRRSVDGGYKGYARSQGWGRSPIPPSRETT